MPKRRPKNQRRVQQRILILCEGKTEANYFEGIKSERNSRNRLSALRIEIFDSEKNTGKEMVKEAKALKNEAKREKNRYEAVWVVLDKDGYTQHPETFKLAAESGIDLAFSSISFEYWFLLHFEYTLRSFKKSAEIIRYLKEKNYLANYKKSADIYTHIRKNTSTASQNAKKVQRHWEKEVQNAIRVYTLNPYTDVDALVDMLLEL